MSIYEEDCFMWRIILYLCPLFVFRVAYRKYKEFSSYETTYLVAWCDKPYTLYFSLCSITSPWPNHPAQSKKKKQLWNRIKITQSKHRKNGGIQLQSEKDKSYQPSCTISVSLSLMGCILQPNLVSVISLEVRVFQWPLKESMHHLCDSLFTFINLSQK